MVYTEASSAPDRGAPRRRFLRVHRAWWIVAAAAATIMASGAYSTMPGLLVDPLKQDLHWSHGIVGFAAWVNMAFNGLVAPFAAAMMERFGLRIVASTALLVLSLGAGLTTVMSEPWQFTLYWGLLIGLGTGVMGGTLAAVVTSRWFVRRRGLATGILVAASVFGQFVFLPVLAAIIEHTQWRAGTVTVALAALVVAPISWLLLRDHPADVGTSPYGADAPVPPPAPPKRMFARPFEVLAYASRTSTFWLLAGTFAICGMSTNGLMWTHFVPAAHDHGMPPTTAASLLTAIGIFNVAGTIASGWLTDRYDARWLLAGYYVLRGLVLLFLPAFLGPSVDLPLIIAVVLFGLLDVATVPPTLALSAIRDAYGPDDSAIVFGWVFAAHQVGAGVMAFAAGLVRDVLHSYSAIWITAAVLCGLAAAMACAIRKPETRPIAERMRK